MKYRIKNIYWLSLTILLLSATFVACENEDDLGSADRLFRPVVSKTSYGMTWIRMEWDKYEGVVGYNVQLSTDSFTTILQDVVTDTTFYRFDDLEYDTDYYIRIKSVGETLESRYYENEVIRTADYPTKIKSISSSNVIDTQVKVSWTDVNYDSLVVISGDTIFKSVPITEEVNANKEIIIRALEPLSSYYVAGYIGGAYQGKRGFTTIAPQVFDGEVLDLRGYSDEESYSLLTQTFFDELAVTYPDGVNVVLSGGTKYELSGGILFSSPINLITGYTVNGRAIVEVSGNFDLPAATAINGNVRLESITFTDHPSKPRTADSNYGGTYLMNISGSGSSLDSLIIESCDIRYKRGLLRIKTDAAINHIVINNCFIDSIAGYGVVNLDASGIVTQSITVSNSTVAHTQLFVRTEKMTATLGKFTLSNVTTYGTPKDANYFFRLGAIEEATVTNCLFGYTAEVEGFYGGLNATNSTISNNFKTSDCTWKAILGTDGLPTGEYKNPIEAEDLGADSYSIFANPDMLDYTVSLSKLVDKIGDPRWW